MGRGIGKDILTPLFVNFPDAPDTIAMNPNFGYPAVNVKYGGKIGFYVSDFNRLIAMDPANLHQYNYKFKDYAGLNESHFMATYDSISKKFPVTFNYNYQRTETSPARDITFTGERLF
jgi:hypothetical protein